MINLHEELDRAGIKLVTAGSAVGLAMGPGETIRNGIGTKKFLRRAQLSMGPHVQMFGLNLHLLSTIKILKFCTLFSFCSLIKCFQGWNSQISCQDSKPDQTASSGAV